ncbi:hypothetical protein [Erwinia oleae]|uniref:hypothetical protein n=1 Tax=Erwinia oleae TaxID=796334 RepID=UPI001364518A|nr:hypothetical protein [Erwinia oleae]
MSRGVVKGSVLVCLADGLVGLSQQTDTPRRAGDGRTALCGREIKRGKTPSR